MKYLFNKYVLTCAIFAVILTFCGEQSIIHRIERARHIAELEEEVKSYEQRLEETARRLDEIDSNSDNLEKYARERYLMHESGEDVYVFDE